MEDVALSQCLNVLQANNQWVNVVELVDAHQGVLASMESAVHYQHVQLVKCPLNSACKMPAPKIQFAKTLGAARSQHQPVQVEYHHCNRVKVHPHVHKVMVAQMEVAVLSQPNHNVHHNNSRSVNVQQITCVHREHRVQVECAVHNNRLHIGVVRFQVELVTKIINAMDFLLVQHSASKEPVLVLANRILRV